MREAELEDGQEDELAGGGEAGELEPESVSREPPAGAPDPVRHSDRVLIVGKTESGKSTLARYLAGQFTGSRQTFVDPKDSSWRFPGVEPARSPAELDLAAPISHFIPSSLTDATYAELFDRLWRARGPRVIWLDEAYGPTRAGYAPEGLRLIVQQGAKHDLGLIACTQRPVNIETTLRTEAEHIMIFNPPPPMIDTRTLAGDMHLEAYQLKSELVQLQRDEGLHSHLWYCRRTGELHRCAPLPPELI